MFIFRFRIARGGGVVLVSSSLLVPYVCGVSSCIWIHGVSVQSIDSDSIRYRLQTDRQSPAIENSWISMVRFQNRNI